jgi:hypothetical protein
VLDETWRTKRERVWRAFEKLRQPVEDTRTSDPLEARDTLNRFCLEAFELRDWLLKSDIDDMAEGAVKRLFGIPRSGVIGDSVALAACADIANASKHYELTHPSYSAGGYATISYERVASLSDLPRHFAAVDQVPRFGDHQWMWLVTAGGKEYDALLLAEAAMRDWERCLLSVGLIEAQEVIDNGMSLDELIAPETNTKGDNL